MTRSEFQAINLTEEQKNRMFDAVDWYLCLYENEKAGYDDTIRAIINSVVSIARGPSHLVSSGDTR